MFVYFQCSWVPAVINKCLYASVAYFIHHNLQFKLFLMQLAPSQQQSTEAYKLESSLKEFVLSFHVMFTTSCFIMEREFQLFENQVVCMRDLTLLTSSFMMVTFRFTINTMKVALFLFPPICTVL